MEQRKVLQSFNWNFSKFSFLNSDLNKFENLTVILSKLFFSKIIFFMSQLLAKKPLNSLLINFDPLKRELKK